MPLTDTSDALETWYNDRFLIGLRQAALRLANSDTGTALIARRKATVGINVRSPFPPELQEVSDQQDREREDRKKRALNPRGGVGMKGGHAPIPLVGVSLAPPQAPGVPTQ